ncbi:MAG TPA: Nif3-like dinuclear metal center hexameric protein, partial [Armatimonadota bacterium]|nr:Nif3-like dinuclear metal center hexameric protein [Armatimonadota bacterium]
ADVLVTGDVKHHEALHALDRGLAVLDAGHYATERPVLDQLANALRDALPDTIHVYVSALHTDPFSPPC